jgi:molybdopterin converting factor small subunit
MGLFDRFRTPSVRVHVLIKGRIGEGWLDVDERLRVPVGTTLDGLVALATESGVPIRQALEHSPHLASTLMLNGERCPIAANGARVLADGDELYLLAPLAGG